MLYKINENDKKMSFLSKKGNMLLHKTKTSSFILISSLKKLQFLLFLSYCVTMNLFILEIYFVYLINS